MMGAAGFDHSAYPEVSIRADKPADEWLHFGLEVWDKHPVKEGEAGWEQGVHGRNLLMAYVEHRRAVLAPPAPPQEQPASGSGEGWRTDDCRARGDMLGDPVEQLVFELSWELEEAALSANDLVTVNREKLRTIAKRVLERAHKSDSDRVLDQAAVQDTRSTTRR